MADIIRIARSSVIKDTRKDAILFLDKCNHLIGQQWQVRYYSNEEQSEIDTVVAIGVKNGTGNDCYRVISYGTRTAIVSVTDIIPDVSELAHGEVAVVKIDDEWYYVTVTDNTRHFDKITGGPYVYYCLSDGYLWFYNEGVLRREDDFYTREELEDTFVGIKDKLDAIDSELLRINDVLSDYSNILREHTELLQEHSEKLKELDNACFPLVISYNTTPTSTIFASGTTNEITIDFQAKKLQSDGVTYLDVSDICKFYYKKSTEEEYTLATNPLTLEVTGENEDVVYNIIGGNEETFGSLRKAEDLTLTFGYRVFSGVTSGDIEDFSDLLPSDPRKYDVYYDITITSGINNYTTFALPTVWGDVYKITDNCGTVDYTESFEKLSQTYTVLVDGIEVEYTVYRWCSKPTVLSSFTYRFYNKLGGSSEEPEYIPTEFDELKRRVDILDSGVDTEGSVKYQVEEAKRDLIGKIVDPSDLDTINASKNLVDESLTFIEFTD